MVLPKPSKLHPIPNRHGSPKRPASAGWNRSALLGVSQPRRRTRDSDSDNPSITPDLTQQHLKVMAL